MVVTALTHIQNHHHPTHPMTTTTIKNKNKHDRSSPPRRGGAAGRSTPSPSRYPTVKISTVCQRLTGISTSYPHLYVRIYTHTYIYICSFACVYDPQTSSPIHEPKPQHYHTNTPPPQKNKGSAVPRGVYTFDAHPLTMAGGVALAALPSRSELLLVGLVG